MAFDGIVIASLVHEFNQTIAGGKIAKIAQPEKDELLFTIKNNRERHPPDKNGWSCLQAPPSHLYI